MMVSIKTFKVNQESNLYCLGLVKGLNEVCKALDRKETLICVLAEDCEDAKYKKLVTVSTPGFLNGCILFNYSLGYVQS